MAGKKKVAARKGRGKTKTYATSAVLIPHAGCHVSS
jgi:hypothetical protein